MLEALLCENIPVVESLSKFLIKPVIIPSAQGFISSLKNHADIQLCRIDNHFFVHPLFDQKTFEKINNNAKVTRCGKFLSELYPSDASYNVCYTGKYLIHNLNYTAPEILTFCKSRNITSIHINQGYARCSILPVNAEAVITADKKSADILKKSVIDVLLIQNGFIKLEGFKYGFIGGCCGISGDRIFFTGNLNKHPDEDKILSFINKYGKKAEFLSEELIDIGSIFFLNQI